MTAELPTALPAALVLATQLLAWWLGRGPERAVALILTTALTLELLLRVFISNDPDFTEFRPGHAARDGLLLIGLTAIALRANRLYPIVMAGAVLVAVLAHLLRWFGLFDGQFSYFMLTTAASAIMFSTLWTGLALHIRRKRQIGVYPDWSNQPTTQTIAAAGKIG